MSHFLQPYNLLYPYRTSYYPYLYSDHIQEQNQSTQTYKAEAIKWLMSLDKCEQYRIFSIRGQLKTFPILQMYIYDRLFVQSCFALKQQHDFTLIQKIDDQFIMKSKTLHVRADEFFDKLLIRDEEQFMDSIELIEGSLDNFNQFLELLSELSNYNFLATSPKFKDDIIQNPEWFYDNSFHSCAEWIIKEFEKNIGLNYRTYSDKKKKNKQINQATIKNYNNGLQEYFQKNLANNKEKLNLYYEQIQQEIQEFPNQIENIFFNNIFSSPAIKILKSSYELQQSFQIKCHQDQNIVQSMLITKFGELVEQKTYFLKKFYPMLINLYQNHMENELYQSEINEKIKIKKDKKRKKKKSLKIIHKKDLDPIELQKKLTSANLLQSNIQRFSRSRSYSHTLQGYQTPPNTPSTWEVSENQSEINGSEKIHSQLIPLEGMILTTDMIRDDNQELQQAYEILFDSFSEKQMFIDDEESIINSQKIASKIIESSINSLLEQQLFNSQQDIQFKEINQQTKKQYHSKQQINQNKNNNDSPLKSSIQNNSNKIDQKNNNNKDQHHNKSHQTKQHKQNSKQIIFQRSQIESSYNKQQQNQQSIIIEQKQEEKTHQSNQKEQHIKYFQSCQELSDELNESAQNINNSKSVHKSIKSQKQLQFEQQQHQKQLEINEKKGQEKMIEIINQNIIDFTDFILKDYDDMLPFRYLVYERVKVVIQNVFYGMQDEMIKLFGSCATGLALLNSDIDIGISGFETYNKIQLSQPFSNLYYAFTARKWVIKSTSIFNSAIPVIKLEIDPTIPFNDYDEKYLNMEEKQYHQWKLLRNRLKSGIKVDISFNCKPNHLGQASTDLVIQWMKEYPTIQQLVLILKTIAKKLGLSESYQGGLSSYSLIIMVYSYLRENRINSDNLGELFLDFIYFYSIEFDKTLYGIGLESRDRFVEANKPSYFFKLQDYCLPMLPITIFSPLNKRLLSGSCVLIDNLFNCFKNIYEYSKERKQYFVNFVSFGKKKQQKLSKDLDNFINKILDTI